MKRKNHSPLPRIKNPFVVVLIAAVATLTVVFVFVAGLTNGDKITRYLRTGWPTSSPSPSCYGDTCPSPSPTSGSCNLAVAPKRTEPLEGPGEFNLSIDWDRIADAQRYGDARKVSAYLRTPYRTQPYFLTEQGLANQCMQPDADVNIGVPKPFSDCSTNKISDTTPVELLVKVEGKSPDGYGLKITGWDNNCPKTTTITRDGAGNVTASKCSGTFGQLKGKKVVTAKVRSTYRNASEILGQQPTCPAGGGLPGETFCPAPTCYRGSCQTEILGTYTAEEGMKVVEAYALPPYHLFNSISWCAKTDPVTSQLVAETTYRLVTYSGNVFTGTAKQIARQLSVATRSNITPRDFFAILAAYFGQAYPPGSAVVVTGGGAGTAIAVSAGTAACWFAGGTVLIVELNILGWELYDIGSSASSYCGAGGTLGEWFKTMCDLYPTYWAGKPAQWCWPDWIPF